MRGGCRRRRRRSCVGVRWRWSVRVARRPRSRGCLMCRRQSVNEWVAAHRAGRGGGAWRRASGAGGRARRRRSRRGSRRRSRRRSGRRTLTSCELPGFLWTRALVCELIDRRFGIRVTEKTAGRYLRGWGFSPQKPARRALEQDPELVAQWLDERYPAIEPRAHREKALILWADEMGLRSDHTAGRSWRRSGRPR